MSVLNHKDRSAFLKNFPKHEDFNYYESPPDHDMLKRCLKAKAKIDRNLLLEVRNCRLYRTQMKLHKK